MLVVRRGEALDERTVADLPDLLRAGDVLVVNDTRVIPARLSGVRRRGEGEVRVEATLHRRLALDRWSAFARPGKRLRAGDRVSFGAADGVTCGLEATVADKGEGGEVTLAFDLAGAALDQAVALHGLMPLPPYIAAKRGEDERDRAITRRCMRRTTGRWRRRRRGCTSRRSCWGGSRRVASPSSG
jgi:S-adenosylmethionine:tRNA ribosyltransferase-isomerase